MTKGEVQLTQNKNNMKKQFFINMFKFSVSEPSSNTSSIEKSYTNSENIPNKLFLPIA